MIAAFKYKAAIMFKIPCYAAFVIKKSSKINPVIR